VLNGREHRCTDEDLAACIALALGVAPSCGETTALRAQMRESFIESANANVGLRLA
jgi:hypothetical protein